MRIGIRGAAIATAAAAAVVVVGVATTTVAFAAGPVGHRGSTSDGGYGYTTIRKGIPNAAERFALTSPDVRDSGAIPAASWANTFGCTGANQQIRLSWHGAPAGTRSYAVTMYDVDAPTGSGFWHWLVWDIPAPAHAIGGVLPAGAVAGTTDAGTTGYFGPCPPTGDIVHHYEITVYALDVPSLGLGAASTPAVVGFTMRTHITAFGRITAVAQR